MTYNDWKEAPLSGSFTVISDSNGNGSTGQTFEYTELMINLDTRYARINNYFGSIIFFIGDVVFNFIEIIDNTNLNKIIHEL